ncbi:MAG: hypothetical protein JW866_03895 [Ignavibacteriales bacterium]|nr:hypothetical protein [Ignavibacteriales bacterium]
MSILKDKISSIIENTCSKSGFLLIDFVVQHINRKMYIEIYIDNEKGITLDDCSSLSRLLKSEIESDEDFVSLDYKLEVSSPGTKRSLKFIQQYPKHINRQFEVHYQNNDELIKFKGKLVKVNEDNLTFELAQENIVINIKEIKTAKVLISI